MADSHDFQDHFSGVAASYAAIRPAYPAELYDFVASAAPSTERSWDCATGNGQAAAGLSPHFDEVYATDASPQQIENATAHENIAYSVQLAEKTNFPQQYFDAVTIAQALHWLDLDAFTIELERVLKPRGVVFAWTYGFFRIADGIDEVVRAEFLRPIESFWPRENASAWRGYSDVTLPFQSIDTPEFPLVCRWNLAELMTYLSTWSAVNRYNEHHGPGLLEHVTDEVAALWGRPEEPRSVSMDFYCLGWRQR